MSADLHGDHLRDWHSAEQNYWATDRPANLVVKFRIDPLTRSACLGAYVPPLDQTAAQLPTVPADHSLKHLNIGEALVGANNLHASGDGGWYDFYASPYRPSIWITKIDKPAMRGKTGLLIGTAGRSTPTISVEGVDMDMIDTMLLRSEDLRMGLDGIETGFLTYSYGSGGQSTFRIADLSLTAQMSSRGLSIGISGNTERQEVRTNVLLAWETLILRFPQFTRYMQQFQLQIEPPFSSKGAYRLE